MGQRFIKTVVIDSADKKPLPYTSIVIPHSNRGTYSNQVGQFLYKVENSDTVVVSAIGYKSKSMLSKNISDTIILSPQVNLLKPVIVKSRKTKSALLGAYHNKVGGSFSGRGQYALYIQNTDLKNALISEASFHISTKRQKELRKESKVRIRIYSLDANTGLPGKDLLLENVVVTVAANQNQVKVDLRRFNIQLPQNGVFLGLDILNFFDTEGNQSYNGADSFGIEFTDKIPDQFTYEKGATGAWRKTSKVPIEGEWKVTNVLFGLSIEY